MEVKHHPAFRGSHPLGGNGARVFLTRHEETSDDDGVWGRKKNDVRLGRSRKEKTLASEGGLEGQAGCQQAEE